VWGAVKLSFLSDQRFQSCHHDGYGVTAYLLRRSAPFITDVVEN